MKILHLGFHLGLSNELYYVSEQLNINMIFKKFTDGVYQDDAKLYNIGHNRAKLAWDNNKDFYNKFDMIITSDTCPISRVFLQNNYQGYLIIYVCNRFDYYDGASLDCKFPDKEYYDLIKGAKERKNVKIISYTEFEHHYARKYHNINIGYQVIKPIGKISDTFKKNNMDFKKIDRKISDTIVKKDLFFVPSYHNDTILLKLSELLKELGINNYNGKYKGPEDIIDFKGVIHIPYAWSNLSLFEALQNGIIYFIPSMNFLLKLKTRGNFFWSPPFSIEDLSISEWYSPYHKNILIYFDSWQDLKHKIKSTNYDERKKIIKDFAKQHEEINIDKWKGILFDWK